MGVCTATTALDLLDVILLLEFVVLYDYLGYCINLQSPVCVKDGSMGKTKWACKQVQPQ